MGEPVGFLPMKVGGVDAGVEVDRWSADDIADVLADLGIPSVGALVAFRWGSSLHECACAYFFACALGKLCGGRIVDPQSGEELSADDAFQEAKSALADAD